MKKSVYNYLLDFIVVFLGILLSFFIDARVKHNDRVEHKNFLIHQLENLIKEDLQQLKIVENTLHSCLEAIDLLIDDFDAPTKLAPSELVQNFSWVSSKMSISFFPQKSIYNQILQMGSLELIESEKLKIELSKLYEHYDDRNAAINLKLDGFNMDFDLNFVGLID